MSICMNQHQAIHLYIAFNGLSVLKERRFKDVNGNIYQEKILNILYIQIFKKEARKSVKSFKEKNCARSSGFKKIEKSFLLILYFVDLD